MFHYLKFNTNKTQGYFLPVRALMDKIATIIIIQLKNALVF